MCIKYGILGENMGQTALKHETTIETAKALPAVAGATLTLNECVALATFCYIILQSVYLIWKWRREAKKGKS
jgi:hypothetical protein